MNKKPSLSAFLAVILMCGLVIANAILFNSVQASTGVGGIPKPSVPEFTVKFVDYSFDIPTTYSTDPYTGEIITHAGYRFINKSIEVTINNIDNQLPYSVEYGLYYNVRVKGHFEKEWKVVFRDTQCPSRTESKFTVIRFFSEEEGYYYGSGSYLVYAPSGGQVDFQVQALAGHNSQIPDTQPQLPWSTGYLTVFVGEKSDWSNTQTITIPEGQTPTPSPATTPPPTASPDQTPTSTPNQETQQTDFYRHSWLWL